MTASSATCIRYPSRKICCCGKGSLVRMSYLAGKVCWSSLKHSQMHPVPVACFHHEVSKKIWYKAFCLRFCIKFHRLCGSRRICRTAHVVDIALASGRQALNRPLDRQSCHVYHMRHNQNLSFPHKWFKIFFRVIHVAAKTFTWLLPWADAVPPNRTRHYDF